MNRFWVDPRLFDCFPGMHLVVAVVSGLDNRTRCEGVDAMWAAAWRNVNAHGVNDARKHPYVDAWRRDFAKLGVSMKRFPTSVEAMFRRALKGGRIFTINPLVDFYNALTLRHICPAGAFDLGALNDPVELRFTRKGDLFTALDSTEAKDIPPDEIAYASGNIILTRHFMWRQSRAGLVNNESSEIFLVSEIPAVAGTETANAMQQDFRRGLVEYFSRDCLSFVLNKDLTEIEWRNEPSRDDHSQ